jgi:hypothetical protein
VCSSAQHLRLVDRIEVAHPLLADLPLASARLMGGGDQRRRSFDF